MANSEAGTCQWTSRFHAHRLQGHPRDSAPQMNVLRQKIRALVVRFGDELLEAY